MSPMELTSLELLDSVSSPPVTQDCSGVFEHPYAPPSIHDNPSLAFASRASFVLKLEVRRRVHGEGRCGSPAKTLSIAIRT